MLETGFIDIKNAYLVFKKVKTVADDKANGDERKSERTYINFYNQGSYNPLGTKIPSWKAKREKWHKPRA